MKIENNMLTQELAWTNQGRSSSAQGNTAFADMLAQAVAEPSACVSSASASAQTTACSASLDAGSQSLCQQTSGLLNALDNYGQALADNSKTLKDIEPLAAELETRAQSLGQDLEQAGQNGQDGQGGLGAIAWQAVTQARVEAIKFRRGDYV
jgi:hypothetical protein